MTSFFSSFSDRPRHHKHVVAGTVAGGVTVVLAGMWLMTSPFDTSRYAPILAEGQAQVILGATGNQNTPTFNADGTINIVPSTTAAPAAQTEAGRGDVLMTNPSSQQSTESKLDQADDSVFSNPDAEEIPYDHTSSWFTN